MCISAAGYLIVADAGNFCLRAITPEGRLRYDFVVTDVADLSHMS